MTTDEKAAVLLEIKAEVDTLKPSLEGLLAELTRQQRQDFDNKDFIIHEFRQLARAIDGFTAQLARLS